MTKQQFLDHFAEMYRVGNRSDARPHELSAEEHWTGPSMAGDACCGLLDAMSRELVRYRIFTAEEMQAVYDTL
jgi:hypothetical protein